MSIRSDAYDICKLIWDSPSREYLKSLLLKLQASEAGYLARGQRAQILSFLIIDQRKPELEKKLHPLHIVPLKDEERILLSNAHRQIVQLNKECIASLSPKLPQCIKSIDPYVKFGYEQLPVGVEYDILTEKTIEKMAASFSKHPAIEVVLHSMLPDTTKMTEGKYAESVLTISETLFKAGVFDAPSDFQRILFSQAKDSIQRIIARHITALTCIQASLSVLDQLVYQAILSNKLPLLDKNNIIEIGQMSKNLVGNGLSLLYQPGEQLVMSNICDIVLVKSEALGLPLGQLWKVEAVHHEYSQEFGSSEELTLREVDENLNPFGHLLEHI